MTPDSKIPSSSKITENNKIANNKSADNKIENKSESKFDELIDTGVNDFVILPAKIRYRHIQLPDLDKPVAALEYKNHTYSIFRACANWNDVKKITSRLSSEFAITATKKGWIIWVFEF